MAASSRSCLPVSRRSQLVFGVILVISLAHSFVSFITNSFEIMLALKRSTWVLFFIFLSRFCLGLYRFTAICFASWFLQSEVMVGKLLLNFTFCKILNFKLQSSKTFSYLRQLNSNFSKSSWQLHFSVSISRYE